MLFNELADQYDQVLPFFAAMAEATLDVVDPRPGIRLLDVGAGRGALAGAALARGCQVTAVDAAPAMVELMMRDFPALRARVMDAHHLGLPDQSFDVAVAGFMIHIVDDAAQVASELRRVLCPGGVVAMTVPGPVHDGGRWSEFHALVGEFEGRENLSQRLGRVVEVRQILHSAGFDGVRALGIAVHLPVSDPETCWRHLMSHGFAGLVRSLKPLDAKELQGRAMAELTRMHHDGGVVLSRGAKVYMATARSASAPAEGSRR